MKYYNGLSRSFGKHTIKVSLQNDTYKGAFYFSISGNVKGIDVITCCDTEDIFPEDVEKWKKENCEIELYETDDEEYCWDVKIGTKEDYWHCDCLDGSDLAKLIIGIEIVSFEEE